MIDKQTFRQEGYIYDSIENYPELIDFEKIKKERVEAFKLRSDCFIWS